jgi:hypothetical protein
VPVVDLERGDVERILDEDGREVLRLLFQDHLSLRAEREKAAVGRSAAQMVSSGPRCGALGVSSARSSATSTSIGSRS